MKKPLIFLLIGFLLAVICIAGFRAFASQTVDEGVWATMTSLISAYGTSGNVLTSNGSVWVSTPGAQVSLVGTTPSLGGSLLAAGACSTATTTVTGATTTMAVVATPASVTNIGDGSYWKAYVSGVDVVTVKVCGIVLSTPAATTYNVRVIQ